MRINILFGILLAVAKSSLADGPLCLIKDCGAVVKYSAGTSLQDALNNGIAIKRCLELANNRSYEEHGPLARTVLLPKDKVISSVGFRVQNLSDVTLQIDGTLEASTYYDEWPVDDGCDPQHQSCTVLPMLSFFNCTHLNIKGEGIIDGLGYDWWVREWNLQNKNNRPHMLAYTQVQFSEISGIKFLNSPRFFMQIYDIDSVYIHDIEIFTSIFKQKESYTQESQNIDFYDQLYDFSINLFKYFMGEYSQFLNQMIGSKTIMSWPVFPLNTDGIDPAGSNVTIRNVNITNFDDAVAVKPAHNYAKVAKEGCTRDVLVENLNVMFGVGMSIGSIGPEVGTNPCVKNVTFREINFEYPLKAIYIKTNPGYTGYGIAEDILYENIKIHFPVWWNIYIGPQQMKQPDNSGPGCMLYPLGGCITQPLIDINNITIRNLNSTGGFLPPGVVRCNKTNPCKSINFENINITGWWEKMNWGFISEYAYGNVTNAYPDPQFGKKSEHVFELFTVENFLLFISELFQFYNEEKTNIQGWQVLIGIAVWAIDYVIEGGHI